MRISLPDQPGVLGSLALALGRGGANIVTLDVIERADGIAIDDLVVEAPEDASQGLLHAARGVPSAVVEAIRPIDRVLDPPTPMELAVAITRATPGHAMEVLVGGVPDALWISWCAVVKDEIRPEIVAKSAQTPSLESLATPWLPVDRPVRFSPAEWMPPEWRKGPSAFEVAAVPFGGPRQALLVARVQGPRFRRSELRDLDLLAQVTKTAEARDPLSTAY